jgi:hypothetical protein
VGKEHTRLQDVLEVGRRRPFLVHKRGICLAHQLALVPDFPLEGIITDTIGSSILHTIERSLVIRIRMANLPPHYATLAGGGEQTDPDENVYTSHHLGVENFGMYCPAYYSEWSDMFSAMPEADRTGSSRVYYS